jgi:hypothetical protein
MREGRMKKYNAVVTMTRDYEVTFAEDEIPEGMTPEEYAIEIWGESDSIDSNYDVTYLECESDSVYAVMGVIQTKDTPPIWRECFDSFEEAWEFIYATDPLPEDANEQNHYYDDYYVTEMSRAEYEHRITFFRDVW